jgi:hypothetical protein
LNHPDLINFMENTGANLLPLLILNGKYTRVISRPETKVTETKKVNNLAKGGRTEFYSQFEAFDMILLWWQYIRG